MAARRRPKKPEGFPAFDLHPGDRVMLGSHGITMPGDWYFATVLWVGDEDILVEQTDLSGAQRYRDVKSLSSVRAVGDYCAMRDLQESARKAVAEKREAFETAQAAMKEAHKDIWRTLDAIGAASADLRGVKEAA